jgi:Fic family protein
MKCYNWQQPDWPHFRYDLSSIEPLLLSIAEKTGSIQGQSMHLDASLQKEALIDQLMIEVIKTSEIEGEYLNRHDVRSSIQNKLGLHKKPIEIRDKRAVGMVDLVFDLRHTLQSPLTDTQLFEWHWMLFSHSAFTNMTIATWRCQEEPMQIVSGYEGRHRIHYEAPPSHEVPHEMANFMEWFNQTAPGGLKAILHAPVRAAIAHLYFESIHPFEDGNGRIGRAIAEKALSQGTGYPTLLSLSQTIEADKKTYYCALHAASTSNEITPWIQYFVDVIWKAQLDVESEIYFILKKAAFFDRYQNQLNDRQLKVIKRMLQEGLKGFEGGMSAKKYTTITGTSKATATRDLQHLFEIAALQQKGKGRSIRYDLEL